MTWNPTQYLRYESERQRPFLDLLARVSDRPASYVVDLGCGTGALTNVLAERWPGADVVGVDSSPEMLERARSSAGSRVHFVEQDIADWKPDRPVDLLFSNAALHWLPDHDKLFPRLARWLASEGTLAVQMADRFWFGSPSQKAIDATVADSRWAKDLSGIGLSRDCVLKIERYIELLRDAECEVDAWTTIYHHQLREVNAAFEWLKGSAIGVLLSALDEQRRKEFERDVSERLSVAFPERNGVTIFPMQRMFLVARKRPPATA